MINALSSFLNNLGSGFGNMANSFGSGMSDLFGGIFGGGAGNTRISDLAPKDLGRYAIDRGMTPSGLVEYFGSYTPNEIGLNKGGIFGDLLSGDNFGSTLGGIGTIAGYMNDREKTQILKDMMQQQLAAMQRQENRAVQDVNERRRDRDFGRSIAVDENGNVVPGLHTRQSNPIV